MIEKIQALLGDKQIIFVCKTGSQLFCENCNDLDLIVVVKDWPKEFEYMNTDGVCLFVYSEEGFRKMAEMRLSDICNHYAVALLFAQGENVLYGENPLVDYDWWKYAKLAVERVLDFGERCFFNKRVTDRINPNCCVKNMVWGLVTCFVIQNGRAEFTPEQRQLIQLCHDHQLPLLYRDRLKSNLLVLLQQEDVA